MSTKMVGEGYCGRIVFGGGANILDLPFTGRAKMLDFRFRGTNNIDMVILMEN